MRWAINKARPPFPVPHPSRSRNANRPFFANHGARNEPSTGVFGDVNLQHVNGSQELARRAVKRREVGRGNAGEKGLQTREGRRRHGVPSRVCFSFCRPSGCRATHGRTGIRCMRPRRSTAVETAPMTKSRNR
ncbi:unnamed protein product [Ixodes pacificus]